MLLIIILIKLLIVHLFYKIKTMTKESEDFNIINNYHWQEFKKGFHILTKEDIYKGILKIKLTDADFIDEGRLQFMTLNDVTR